MLDRVERLKATLLLYVVGAEQSQHLAMIFDVAEMAGWLRPPTRAVHVAFGFVLGTDRKKLKSRSGEPVRFVDVVDEAIERATASQPVAFSRNKAVCTTPRARNTTKPPAVANAYARSRGGCRYQGRAPLGLGSRNSQASPTIGRRTIKDTANAAAYAKLVQMPHRKYPRACPVPPAMSEAMTTPISPVTACWTGCLRSTR